MTVAEIISRLSRLHKDVNPALNAMYALSKIVDFDERISMLTGRLHAEIKSKVKNFSLADACILATARINDAKVITCDQDFKDIPRVMLIKK